ncbi:2-keto-4-pentenoate hydratase [Noviherbaspirillum humi]|nr:2-keto-4-pentenoate hydratase [Noviherbaspirillum humi]
MSPEQISESFRQARRDARLLAAFPGTTVPASLEAAYAIQEMGIKAWPDQVGGWKVALIQPAMRDRFPAERYAGPVFAGAIWQTDGQPVGLPVIDGGYAAIEAEFALRVGTDIPAGTRFDGPEQLLPYINAVHGAIELAASPLASLSALGPGATISDFGNNSGLVIGPRLDETLFGDPEQATSSATINGELVGSGNAAKVPGGPLGALLFLVKHLNQRGRHLKAGCWISTGASTGIHPVRIGDRVQVAFGEAGCIEAVVKEAAAMR